jgi:cytochrome P450
MSFSYDPFDWRVHADPYPYYRVLRDEHPAYLVEGRGFWVLSRYDDIVAAVKDTATWSSRANGNLIDDDPSRVGRTLGTTDPPRHSDLRGLVNKAFTPRQVARLEPAVRSYVRDLVEALRDRQEVDFVDAFSAALTAQVIGSLLGVPAEDHARCRVWADALIHRGEGGETDRQAMADLQGYMAALVAERRATPREDLISGLVRAEEAGARLSDAEIVITSATMLGAGFESTNYQIANTLVALAQHPDQRKLVRDAPDLVPAMVEESLRWDPATQGFARTTTRDVVIGGAVIPPGSKAMLLYASANRDERHYDDPDRFDVKRDVGRHLGFGLGAHFCVGAALGRLELRVAFEELLPALGDYEVDLDAAERVHNPTFRGFTRLPVLPATRTNAA